MKKKNEGLKKTLLLIENMEFDIKYILLEEYYAETIRTESVKKRCFKYIKDKCNTLPISIRNMACNVIYRSYFKWLDMALSFKENEDFEEELVKFLNTDYVCVYDINGDICSLRKQIENIITYDKKNENSVVMKQHFLERKLREVNKKYLLCLKFGEKSQTIEKLAYKYYNYIRNRKVEYDKYCQENELRRSDWRCKILMSQKFKDSN